MKKFTKMLALGMAAALTFGMTVNAAGSVSTGDVETVDIVNAAISAAPVLDAAGNAVDVKAEAAELTEDVYSEAFGSNYEDAVDKAINSAVVSPKIDEVFKATFPGVSADRMDLYSDIVDISVEGEIPAGGLYVPVLPAVADSAYVVAHWNGTAWEVLATKVENNVVYALFPEGFSPVCITIVTVGEEKEPDNNGGSNDNNNDNSGNDSQPVNNAAPASPKTGETLPLAGILAVICLAGAAVCAKKVRYNR